MKRKGGVLAMMALLLWGCASSSTPEPEGKKKGPVSTAFSASQLVKTDLDRMADAHRREAFAAVRRLTEKLYRRNPKAWRASGAKSFDEAMAKLIDHPQDWYYPELNGRRSIEVLRWAFHADYRGDRVLALAVGLSSMLDSAFDGKQDFNVLDSLDAQKLYNCARNVEIAAWKLNNSRDERGEPLLLANEIGVQSNLSFEREFGRLIGNLDLLAAILADKDNRSLSHIAQAVATAMFLPVGR